jgi:hypothetical protein
MKYNYSFNTVFSSLSLKNRGGSVGNSLDRHCDIARSSVDDITDTIKRIYDRPDTTYIKKALVNKKEKDLMGTLDKAGKKRFILKKKLFCVLSPLEDEERLVDDLIKLSNLRSLSELVGLNQGKGKKKDILKLFRLRRMKKDEDGNADEGVGNADKTCINTNDVGISSYATPGDVSTINMMNKTTMNPSISPGFRKPKINRSEIHKQTVRTPNRSFLTPVVVRGSKFLEKIKTNNPPPRGVGQNIFLNKTSLKMPIIINKNRTIDVDKTRRKHLSSIF